MSTEQRKVKGECVPGSQEGVILAIALPLWVRESVRMTRMTTGSFRVSW